ncbi:FAR1 DNA-binding domain [Carpediemonas membranifera]|uniref:FAR1 DNA-binding domain n=1 Tax=Carpediemonas membranifera TaxID=201153 RepID=A0A8J6B2V7_9EUKA|nr:FAR1 DNA-binding domain [Carpediemonas membranifera]|eukprot:KAG9393094.1 FAR1 DNA-binding domain [Carpediemonas membranifera]
MLLRTRPQSNGGMESDEGVIVNPHPDVVSLLGNIGSCELTPGLSFSEKEDAFRYIELYAEMRGFKVFKRKYNNRSISLRCNCWGPEEDDPPPAPGRRAKQRCGCSWVVNANLQSSTTKKWKISRYLQLEHTGHQPVPPEYITPRLEKLAKAFSNRPQPLQPVLPANLPLITVGGVSDATSMPLHEDTNAEAFMRLWQKAQATIHQVSGDDSLTQALLDQLEQFMKPHTSDDGSYTLGLGEGFG